MSDRLAASLRAILSRYASNGALILRRYVRVSLLTGHHVNVPTKLLQHSKFMIIIQNFEGEHPYFLLESCEIDAVDDSYQVWYTLERFQTASEKMVPPTGEMVP